MKKITPVILAAVLIVISCIFIAGCVTTPAVTIDKENPAYSVTVKASIGYDNFPTGGIFEIQVPDNGGSTGYTWQVIAGSEILYKEFTGTSTPVLSRPGLLGGDLEIKPRDGDSESEPASSEEKPAAAVAIEGPVGQIVGASHPHYFWFQPSKAGDYTISLKYAQPWEGGDTCAVYTQTIHVVDSNEPIANGAQTSYIFDSFYLNPVAGSTVKVIKEANPTTGYYWTASGEGLTIEEEFIPADSGLLGSPGKYQWYAAAANPGDYTLKAELKHAGSDEVLSVFEIPMKFV
ncbi:MAG TPA: protease inhibitor I42 family protein [Methanocorpusculum sp.]|nr:protease inhibitor I42 family protein [Methanocorpusculum sp.]HJJ44704.1 protease inhibitor I42 family protein [Methanocorpusculum sp.]HJJ58539.1 protease inhibitor I42 family protein [Methanocorpusculum sp.]HJJ60083.1 protease inhibitor I42 family protein [Methanocorpusculum sp.]